MTFRESFIFTRCYKIYRIFIYMSNPGLEVKYTYYGEKGGVPLYQASLTTEDDETTFEGTMDQVKLQVAAFQKKYELNHIGKLHKSEAKRLRAEAKAKGGGGLNKSKKIRLNRKPRKTMRRRKSKKTMSFMF